MYDVLRSLLLWWWCRINHFLLLWWWGRINHFYLDVLAFLLFWWKLMLSDSWSSLILYDLVDNVLRSWSLRRHNIRNYFAFWRIFDHLMDYVLGSFFFNHNWQWINWYCLIGPLWVLDNFMNNILRSWLCLSWCGSRWSEFNTFNNDFFWCISLFFYFFNLIFLILNYSMKKTLWLLKWHLIVRNCLFLLLDGIYRFWFLLWSHFFNFIF